MDFKILIYTNTSLKQLRYMCKKYNNKSVLNVLIQCNQPQNCTTFCHTSIRTNSLAYGYQVLSASRIWLQKCENVWGNKHHEAYRFGLITHFLLPEEKFSTNCFPLPSSCRHSCCSRLFLCFNITNLDIRVHAVRLSEVEGSVSFILIYHYIDIFILKCNPH